MKTFKFVGLILLIVSSHVAHTQSKPEIFSGTEGAVGGYDVVAFFSEAKPVKGTPEFTHTWKDGTWHFVSQNNLDLFKANPEKYAPQYGGYCAFGMSRGYKAPTQIETWTIVDGKLYFNYNLDVKKEWTKTPGEYIMKADKNWPDVRKN